VESRLFLTVLGYNLSCCLLVGEGGRGGGLVVDNGRGVYVSCSVLWTKLKVAMVSINIMQSVDLTLYVFSYL
jgi:hypothetical protein